MKIGGALDVGRHAQPVAVRAGDDRRQQRRVETAAEGKARIATQRELLREQQVRLDEVGPGRQDRRPLARQIVEAVDGVVEAAFAVRGAPRALADLPVGNFDRMAAAAVSPPLANATSMLSGRFASTRRSGRLFGFFT